MAVAAQRTISITFTGGVVSQLAYPAAADSDSPGVINLVTLASGANTITPPANAVSLTIIPPSGNTTLMTLKGVTGDTGVPIHKTDPTSIGLDTTFTTLCLTAAAQITGVRLIWT